MGSVVCDSFNDAIDWNLIVDFSMLVYVLEKIVIHYNPLSSTGVAWADGPSSSGDKCLSN